MTDLRDPSEALAAAIAARLIHDFSGPASGVITGLDLQSSGDGTLAASGLELANESARALLDMLEVWRVAFAGRAGPQAADALARMADACFEGRRARLDWTPQAPSYEALPARAVLLACQIAAGGLASGGVAALSAGREGDRWRVRLEGRGPRAGLPPEALSCLIDGAGEIGGRWAPAAFLRAMTANAGGQLAYESLSEGFALTVSLPADG